MIKIGVVILSTVILFGEAMASNKTLSDRDVANAQMVQLIASDIAKAVGQRFKEHGDDSDANVIIAAGISIFIDKAETLTPGVKQILIDLLLRKSGKPT
jgi:hypothetical protein